MSTTLFILLMGITFVTAFPCGLLILDSMVKDGVIKKQMSFNSIPLIDTTIKYYEHRESKYGNIGQLGTVYYTSLFLLSIEGAILFFLLSF